MIGPRSEYSPLIGPAEQEGRLAGLLRDSVKIELHRQARRQAWGLEMSYFVR